MSTTKHCLSRVLLGLLFCCGALEAQGGGARLELQVLDDRGQGIAQAAVLLRPETDQPVALPPPSFSDEDGWVRIEGLVEGEWQIEVRAGGYMIFTGYIKLLEGLPPVVGFTTKQRTGSFWAPLDVMFGGSAELEADDLALAAKGADKSDRKDLKKAEKKLRKEEKRERELEEQRLAAAEAAERNRARASGGAEIAVLAEPAVETEAIEEDDSSRPQPGPVPTAEVPSADPSDDERAAVVEPDTRVAASPVAQPDSPRTEVPPRVPQEPPSEGAAPRRIESSPVPATAAFASTGATESGGAGSSGRRGRSRRDAGRPGAIPIDGDRTAAAHLRDTVTRADPGRSRGGRGGGW